jgi:hypothetical protein
LRARSIWRLIFFSTQSFTKPKHCLRLGATSVELFIWVNDAARRSRQIRFTALLHHVDVEALERAFRRLRRKAAPGMDGTGAR